MKLFDIDGSLFAFLNRMADLCLLNILFLISCLPIITIGASLTALHTVTLQMAGNQEGYIIRSFFSALKKNFRQATIIWIPIFFIAILMIIDIRIFNKGEFSSVLLIGAYFILFLLAYVLIFCFPVLAKFENSIKRTLINAFAMSLSSLPYAICILLIVILPVSITAFLPVSLSFLYMLWLLFGFSLLSLFTSYIFDKKIFKKFIPKD